MRQGLENQSQEILRSFSNLKKKPLLLLISHYSHHGKRDKEV